jgi:glycosyltransferase involved in cell wall biosynthesis
MIQSVLAQLSFWFYRYTRAFDSIDNFFVLTEFQREKVQALGLDDRKIMLKPNSLDMKFEMLQEKTDYIYVGRLEESKGIYELLDAWSQLDGRFRLTIVGGGDIDAQLRQSYPQNNIFFRGKLSRGETLKAISKSKYLIQPSILYETFGLTIIEAMSYATPVIGFDIGTRGQFIQDGVNGFLSDDANLVEVIRNSFNHKDYVLLGKNAVETAKLYENNYVIAKQVELYKDVLQGRV